MSGQKWMTKPRIVIGTTVLISVVMIVAITVLFASAVRSNQASVLVYSSLVPIESNSVNSNKWKVFGVVTHQSDPLVGATTWVSVTSELGNTLVVRDTKSTDEFGNFGQLEIDLTDIGEDFSGFPGKAEALDRLRTFEVVVHVQVPRTEESKAFVVERVHNFDRVRPRQISPHVTPIVLIVMAFVLSLGLAFLPELENRKWISKFKYFGSISLACLFVAIMIASILIGLISVERYGNQSRSNMLTVGFANIYVGTYVEDVPKEWLFSLTAPQNTGPNDTESGFGAPLWVILVSVVGAGIFTLRTMVLEVIDPLKFEDGVELRTRVYRAIVHQYFILLSPIAAVFVYQLLVATGTASKHYTVALMAFSAGLMINHFLDRSATDLAKRLAQGDSHGGGQAGGQPDDQGNGQAGGQDDDG